MQLLFIISIDLFLTALFLWLGMKLMQLITGEGWQGEYCPFRYLLLAAIASSVAAIIPVIGLILSWIVLLALLIKFTSTSLKDVLIMVILAKMSAFVVGMYLIALI